MELPVQYIENMKALLGSEYDAYEKCFDEKRYAGLRVNQKKTEPEELRKLVPFDLQQVPWISNGYYVAEGESPAKHPYYYAGLYYIQEPSAMTPANLLPVEPCDKILDLCGAPGGKATELGARLNGSGFLLANDLSNSRAKAMLKNLELFGIENLFVTSEAPEKLVTSYEQFFDKILVDAPCSGEGMFRKDPALIKSWLTNGPDYYSTVQKDILRSAVKMLKPGGTLLYSTCTFSEEEDEKVIETILAECTDMKLIPFERRFEGFCEGRRGLTDCIRIFPHKVKGEGHFLALLQKAEGTEIERKPEKQKGVHLEKEVLEFLTHTTRQFSPERFFQIEDEIYYLPEGINPKRGIRYLRTGLKLGSLKNRRFEPSQTLAMALSKDEFDCVLSLRADDIRVIKYLKGETISFEAEELSARKGWCLVAVDGFSLGFAKINGQALKNKLRPGWRML